MTNLPFFMKPGLLVNNVMSMKFDNGCRLIGRNTTKKTGIGLSINLLYMDEFAHIDDSYLDFFYGNIYPTVTGLPNSKIIITSTPNGLNRFHEIWIQAIDRKSSYFPIRVDYWQAPGRDEEWKRLTIANLGSEETFNQQYGLQFFSSDKLLLDSGEIKKIYGIKENYEQHQLDCLNINGLDFSRYFSVHPKFKSMLRKSGHDDFRHLKDYFLFSIDCADGIGKDFSVVNIFKLSPIPFRYLLRHRTAIHREYDLIGAVQVASFRTHNLNISQFSDAVQSLLFRAFNCDYVRVVLELNMKGEVIYDRLRNHGEFWPGLLIHSKHTLNAEFWSPGIILNSAQKKSEYCEKFKYMMTLDRVVPNEEITVLELGTFGKTNGGSYRGQSGHDDMAISCTNLVAFFDSPQFFELCGEVYNSISDQQYLLNCEQQIFEYNRVRENADRKIDMIFLNTLNQST